MKKSNLVCPYCHQSDFKLKPSCKNTHYLECLQCGARSPRALRTSFPEIQPCIHDKSLIRTFVDKLPSIIFVKSVDGYFILCNQAFTDFFNITYKEIEGKNELDFQQGDIANPSNIFDPFLNINLKINDKSLISLKNIKTGSLHEFEITIRTIKWINGKQCILVSGQDVTEHIETEKRLKRAKIKLEKINDRLEQLVIERTSSLKKANRELQQLASIDQLTGIGNRHMLNSWLEKQSDEADFVVMMIDIDHFKQINDRFGHKIGDHALVEFARYISDNTRREDLVVRWGGEEFIIIYKNMTLNNALKLADNLRLNIESMNILPNRERMTVSIGISKFIKLHFENAILAADTALYQAKKSGRNKTVVFSG